MNSSVIVLRSIGGKFYTPSDRSYLDAIIELYPKYRDKAFENYLNSLEEKE